MGYPVCPNRIHSSGINGPRKSLFEITKSFLGDGHRLKLFFGVWESGDVANHQVLPAALGLALLAFGLLVSRAVDAVAVGAVRAPGVTR